MEQEFLKVKPAYYKFIARDSHISDSFSWKILSILVSFSTEKLPVNTCPDKNKAYQSSVSLTSVIVVPIEKLFLAGCTSDCLFEGGMTDI